MKKIILVLMLIPLLNIGQDLSKDFTISTGTPYKVVDARSKEYIPLANGNVLMAKTQGELVTIQLFDGNEMKEIARTINKDMPKYTKFIDVINVNEKVFYIFEAYNKKEKTFTIYSREIFTSDAKFGKLNSLFTTSRKVTTSPATGEIRGNVGAFTGFTTGPKFIVKKSFDNSKILINYRLYPLTKKDSENYDEIGFYVFDNEMNKIWGNEVKMPYTEAQINNVAYSISSKGSAIMLIAQRKLKKYEALVVTKDGLKAIKLDISTDKMVKTMKVKELPNGDFVCAGFYANGIEFNFWGASFDINVNGLMYFKVNPEGGLIQSETFDFSKEFIMQNLSDRQKNKVEKREEKGKAGIINLLLIDFILKEDGSAYFVGERQFAQQSKFSSSKMEYFFLNAVVIKVDNKGELKWMKKLPKYQVGSRGRGQMGIAYMEGKTADYVTYVDNPKNIKLDPSGGVPVKHVDNKGGFLTSYKVDHATGDLEKQTILDLVDIKGVRAYQFNTSRIVHISDGVFFMEIYIKGKKDTMVKFKLN